MVHPARLLSEAHNKILRGGITPENVAFFNNYSDALSILMTDSDNSDARATLERSEGSVRSHLEKGKNETGFTLDPSILANAPNIVFQAYRIREITSAFISIMHTHVPSNTSKKQSLREILSIKNPEKRHDAFVSYYGAAMYGKIGDPVSFSYVEEALSNLEAYERLNRLKEDLGGFVNYGEYFFTSNPILREVLDSLTSFNVLDRRMMTKKELEELDEEDREREIHFQNSRRYYPQYYSKEGAALLLGFYRQFNALQAILSFNADSLNGDIEQAIDAYLKAQPDSELQRGYLASFDNRFGRNGIISRRHVVGAYGLCAERKRMLNTARALVSVVYDGKTLPVVEDWISAYVNGNGYHSSLESLQNTYGEYFPLVLGVYNQGIVLSKALSQTSSGNNIDGPLLMAFSRERLAGEIEAIAAIENIAARANV